MKTAIGFLLMAMTVVGIGRPAEPSSESLDARLTQTAADYEKRIVAATEELNRVREATAAERVPLVEATRALQQRSIALETELMLLKADAARKQAEMSQLDTVATDLRRNLAYLRTTADEQLQSLETSLLPGEAARHDSAIRDLRNRLQPDARQVDPEAVVESMDLALRRIEELLGGQSIPGEALANGTNTMQEGYFVFLGPETYFRANDGGLRGLVRLRSDSQYPVVHSVPWDDTAAAALADGAPATFPADAQGGKALRLAQAKGTWRDHVAKGGVVGYIILTLGAIAVVISLSKFVDLRGLAVDAPGPVNRVLAAVRAGNLDDARQLVARLRRTTRELLTLGLQQSSNPKTILEEQLYAQILQLRLHHERRLPLLGVIVTASPLLGLLGTVTGMVTTFTLITVFGTGDAEKLSSGISEALVTTELGLMVAIPTLVIHGYLGHRVRKQLAMLERYAIEFVTATDLQKSTAVAQS